MIQYQYRSLCAVYHQYFQPQHIPLVPPITLIWTSAPIIMSLVLILQNVAFLSINIFFKIPSNTVAECLSQMVFYNQQLSGMIYFHICVYNLDLMCNCSVCAMI